MTLSARIAALEGPDRAVDAKVAVAIGEYLADPLRYPGMFAHKDTPKQWGCGVPRYTASLDAAMPVVPEGWVVERAGWHALPGIEPAAYFSLWQYECDKAGKWFHGSEHSRAEAQSPTPALALLSAALMARGL